MLALACTASFSLTGVAAACKKSEEETAADDDKKTSVEDTQLLKNGNFEVFEVPDDAVYLIKNPTSWTQGGSSSYTKSGIIGTSKKAWEQLTDSALAGKLDANNDLDPNDSNYKDDYVDYNGMKSSDIFYKDTYAALNNKDEDSENSEDKPDSKALIENPGTHYNVQSDDNGLYYTDDSGQRHTVYEDENGDYYLEKKDDKYEQPISHVLMLHNYATSHNGIAQNYSSVSVTLPANTAAEVSLWVKTGYLKYDQGNTVEQDHGANVTVTHTVGSTTLDDFKITDINTEKLISEGKAVDKYSGWVNYTVYVNACDFAESTITLKLGLGEENYLTEGYAFFDDVTVTKFVSLDSEKCSYTENAGKIEVEGKNATCDLSSDESEKIFRADSYSRNGEVKDVRFSKNFHYLIDLASESDYKTVTFNGATAGLTVDTDKYASSKTYGGKLLGFTSATGIGEAKLPTDFTALGTENDLLAYVKAGHSFTASETKYSDLLNKGLDGVATLPKLSEATDNNVLVMLSEFGAAYTSTFELTIDKDGYKIISFWVKTSDMNGNTAATVKISDKNDEEVTSNVTLDTTDVKTDIDDDNKDIYKEWVQCFFFVHNEDTEARTLKIDFSFGNTTIKGTTANSYKAGWAALANMQTLDVSEEIFAYTGSGEHTASLTLTADEEKKTSVFDEVYGSQTHEIENNIVNPSTYTGVNGGSSAVVNNGTVSLPFDDINKNANAGLINKEYFGNYTDKDWYTSLKTSFNVSTTDAITAWNEIFGSTSIQPLLIVNKLRQEYVLERGATADSLSNYYIKDEDGNFVKVAADAKFDENTEYYSLKDIMNYGFIGSDKTISANGYSTVSVKVKVSKGAIAYVYLVDTAAGKEVLSFTAPTYSFRYDEDGNVLKAELKKNATLSEQRENILYSLRDDGLYEDKDGKLFANVWNYTKVYKDRTQTYYNADGKVVSFNDLVEGETYYKDAEHKTLANHFLATTDGDKIYELRDGEYYYLVEGKATDKVSPFDTAYARYDYSGVSEKYMVKIDGTDENVAGKWITVNFVINAGSDEKKYRLELWSGSRDSYNSGECTDGSAVLFDYSYTAISDSALMEWYEQEIISDYKTLLSSKGLITSESIETSTENVSYYEKLVAKYLEEGKLQKADIKGYELLNNYTAHYYTFSLYDSANYHPFNKDVAEDNETGYDYDVNKYSETLAYLTVKGDDSYTVFTDYSAIDQSFDIGTDDGDDSSDEEESGDNTTVWLLVSSILLVVAMLFTILSLMIRDMVKKSRRNKVSGKNNYNQHKRNRYVRKLHLNTEEFEEVDGENADGAEDNATAPEAEAQTPAEEQNNAEAEAPVEAEAETPVEDVQSEEPAEESPVEEQPAEDTQSEEPAEGDGDNN